MQSGGGARTRFPGIGIAAAAGACCAIAAVAVVLALPAPADAKTPRSFYGVNTQRLPTTADIDRMGRGRVGSLRFQLRWSAVERTPELGVFDWSEVDQIVADAARNRIRLVPFVYSTPPWVASTIDGRSGCAPDCTLYPPTSPEALWRWGQFLYAAVDRYGPNGKFWAAHPELPTRAIRSWQIWNEPNSPPFYRPSPNVAHYRALLEAASYAIRRRDPGARIVLPGMYGWPLGGDPPAMTSWEFLRELYSYADTKPMFDVVAVHPYAAAIRGVLDQIDRTRELMRRHGDAKTPIWVTEIGWASAGPKGPLAPGPRTQAKRVRQLYGHLGENRKALNIRRVLWFSWRDDTAGTPVCAWCDYSGLFTEQTFEPKRSWRAFRKFTGGR